MEKLSVRGYGELLGHLREILAIRRRLAGELLRERPDLFIGVDSSGFNLGLERRMKEAGIPAIHYVSPAIWAWRGWRIREIARSVSHILVMFPFEEPLYRKAGVPVTYVGHPLAAEAAGPGTRAETREVLRIKGSTPVFALLPGSRLSEIELHADLVLDAAARIAEARPDACFLVPLVSRATRDAFETALHRNGHAALPLTLLYGHASQALQAADVALVASGTASLEAALARCPHVIFYRVSSMTARMVARRLLLPYVGLPNVLAGRFVVPELLQNDATPGNLAQAALNLFDDTVTRRRLEALFARFGVALRAPTGSLAAEAVVQELQNAGVPC
jgi:lipid-A-disaccharide synthase